MAQVVEMKLYKLLLCTAVLFCMIAQVYAQGEQSPAANTYSDPATNEIKQFLEGPQSSDLSQKGKPPAGSSLAKTEIGQSQTITPQNYLVKADLFLDGITANNLYIVTVPEFLEMQKADPNWVIVDIRPAVRYSSGHIENSMNIPFSDLVLMMNMIPVGKKVAVYSDYDTDAAFGVMTLRVFGDRAAWILQGGVPAWQSAGMTVV
jgi:rhodanese-related sulfurtransferase